MKEQHLKRQILTQLLIGENHISADKKPWKIMRSESFEKQGVLITPMKYESREYPYLKTNHVNGKTIKNPVRALIPALLLEPSKENRKAGKGIIALHQHALNFELGKSEPAGLVTGPDGPSQHYGLELAQRGYTVLCFDFPGFEERKLVSTDKLKKEHAGKIANVDEHFIKQEASLSKLELMGLYVLDTMRAVDVLEKLGITEVGVIGHSLGGMVLSYAMACDPRIKVGASNCGVATYQSIGDLPMLHNLAYCIHGIRKELGEWHEICNLTSPRLLLISAGTKDPIFPIEGVRNFVKWGKRYYKGCEDMLQLFEFAGEHKFPDEARKEAYHFLDQHL